ncbi:hypothetical protein GCM10010452_85780 [Crossiella cryophila]
MLQLNGSWRGGLLVPAFFQPDTAAADWRRLIGAVGPECAVVLNVDGGAGPRPAAKLQWMVQQLKYAGARVLGYVDTCHGRCARELVYRELVRHRAWYRVDGVFFDRVQGTENRLPLYRQLAGMSRSADCAWVVLNTAGYPHPRYLDFADLVLPFEGPMKPHENLHVPAWAEQLPRERFGHLVNDTPELMTDQVLRQIATANAGWAYVTEQRGWHPWHKLAMTLHQQLSAVRRGVFDPKSPAFGGSRHHQATQPLAGVIQGNSVSLPHWS